MSVHSLKSTQSVLQPPATPASQLSTPVDSRVNLIDDRSKISITPVTFSELLLQGSRDSVGAKSTKSRQTRSSAALKIYNCWQRYRNQKMFHLIKHAILAAERSMSEEVLRKVSPNEAELLSDKAINYKVRFRFGGSEFPPQIFFKVFLGTNSAVTYVCGKKMIRPDSEAAEDSLRLMGNRTYYDKILKDTLHHSQYKITDMVDVSTLKDYIQYCSTLDETPSQLGGRENSWRKLSLQDLPRYCVFRDIVEFLDNHRSLSRMMVQYPELLLKPTTQDILLQHINIITHVTLPEFKPVHSNMTLSSRGQSSSRRSNRTIERSEKMRQTYMSQVGDMTREVTLAEEDDWEEEAGRLYKWSQTLSC